MVCPHRGAAAASLQARHSHPGHAAHRLLVCPPGHLQDLHPTLPQVLPALSLPPAPHLQGCRALTGPELPPSCLPEPPVLPPRPRQNLGDGPAARGTAHGGSRGQVRGDLVRVCEALWELQHGRLGSWALRSGLLPAEWALQGVGQPDPACLHA